MTDEEKFAEAQKLADKFADAIGNPSDFQVVAIALGGVIGAYATLGAGVRFIEDVIRIAKGVEDGSLLK